MAEIDISQIEANFLIGLEKHYDPIAANDSLLSLPDLGGKLNIPFICSNKREKFSLDVTRGRIALTKETRQLRGRQVIILLRLDVGGRPHRNPDDVEIPSPHLHIYKEGFADKWAYPVPIEKFKNLLDSEQTLMDFMLYCNITVFPKVQRGLFT